MVGAAMVFASDFGNGSYKMEMGATKVEPKNGDSYLSLSSSAWNEQMEQN
jgi:hypothetical protein